MTNSVKVMAAILPDSATEVTIRVRWVLVETDAVMTQWGTADKVSFPHAADRFRVTLTDEDTGQQRTQDAYPRSFVMLDPPREYKVLGAQFVDWLPEDRLANWAPVDPRNEVLVDPGPPPRSKALGVGHLLRFSHAEEVVIRIRLQARHKLEQLRHTNAARFGGMDDAELDTHASVFAAAFNRAPFHPVELFGKLRAILIEQAQARPMGGPTPIPGWLLDALTGGDPGIAAAPESIDARLAALVHLMLEQGLRTSAAIIAKEAVDMRGLMALRASQGGTLIDYWCDFDKADSDASTPLCDPSNRGKVCVAAEAFGVGLDFKVPMAEAGHVWRIDVEHIAAVAAPHQAGTYKLTRSAGQAVQTSGTSSFPPPAPANFTASVDYQLVSSHALDATLTFEGQLEKLMAFAKPVTGDGQLTIQVARAHDATDEPFEFDYPYNVYCAWDGESSGELQPWFDDPAPLSLPSLEQLRPFLVTRRYSHRRDIDPALTAERITDLKLLTEPPHEATLGLPDSITDPDGAEIPYPSRNDGQAQARISINLRDIMPSLQHAAFGVKWERRGGGRPDLYDETNLWTVELPRPGTVALPADRLPQRYRMWVTAVDIFEQESAPVEVFAREPGEDDDASPAPTAIFVPRWRSPPPPPDEVKTIYTAATQRLEVKWIAGMQLPVGTAIGIARLALDAEVVVMRRPIREIIAAAPALAALTNSGANPVLQRAVAGHEADGWVEWQRNTVQGPAVPGAPWRVGWTLDEADRGYEYRAVIGHAVQPNERKFLHRDLVQTVRYLVRSGTGANARYDERYWQIPETGELARYRNHPAFSPAARSDVATAMPEASEVPGFGVQLSTARLIVAAPVPGVQGIDRDLALAKFIMLRDTVPAAGLSTARALMIDAALARMEPGALGEYASGMVRALIGNQFATADQGSDKQIIQHPVIGLRGAVLLRWSDTDNSRDHVPTVLYRVYTARGAPSHEVHARIRCTGAGSFTVVSEAKASELKRPGMILIDGQARWTGLATRNGADITVRGLGESPVTQQGPQVGTEYDCWFSEGYVAAEVKPEPANGLEEFEAALPVAGGHSETGIWWLAAVNCVNKESWLRADGTPAMLALHLPETIVPSPPARLEARPPHHFETEAATEAAYDALRAKQVLPDLLQRNEGPIFPRTILTWDPAEYGAAEQYLLIERQDESDADAMMALMAPDPAWGLLKAIETQAAGAPWSDDYLALKPWLGGGPSPQPPEGLEPAKRAYFFPTTKASDHAAWKFKEVDMLPASDHPWKNARSFADYFAEPPVENRSSVTRGERRVRYRAFKMVDLKPGLPGPDPAEFYTRYLVSEPSAWTGWIRPDWPPFTFEHNLKAGPRANAPLVRFDISSAFATVSAASMNMQDTDGREVFFRVEIRRRLDTAFGETETTALVGELVGIPIPDRRLPVTVQTADYSLERADPGAATQAFYTCSAALVARQNINGNQIDTVLRMADTAPEFKVDVAATTGTVEQAVTVELQIRIG